MQPDRSKIFGVAVNGDLVQIAVEAENGETILVDIEIKLHHQDRDDGVRYYQPDVDFDFSVSSPDPLELGSEVQSNPAN